MTAHDFLIFGIRPGFLFLAALGLVLWWAQRQTPAPPPPEQASHCRRVAPPVDFEREVGEALTVANDHRPLRCVR